VTSSRGRHVAIIGAGVIGLSCALEIRRRGFEVTVVEQGTRAGEATWAAAGVVAPHHYGATPGPLYELLRRSRGLYPAFVQSLSRRSLDWHENGTVAVARTEAESEELEARVHWLNDADYSGQLLTRAALSELEPLCDGDFESAAFFPGDAHVDPRQLGLALKETVLQAGVQICFGSSVERIETIGSAVSGLSLSGDDHVLPAEAVVLAAGAWSAGLAPGFRLPVRPAKGQMCAVQTGGLRRPVEYPAGVIIPRTGGVMAVGATVEDVGFDLRINPDSITELRSAAADIVSVVADAEIVETWLGFRPRTADGFPIVGQSVVDGLVVSTGHDTKGIALAPVTAKLVADLVCDGHVDALLTPFSPERFA